MQKYLITSKTFEGFICYAFDKLGYLVEFRNCTYKMSEEQKQTCLKHLGYCLSVGAFFEWVNQYGFQLHKVRLNLTFEEFYDFYGVPRNKQEGRAAWEKHMKTDEDKQFLFHAAEACKRYAQRHGKYQMMIPDRFIKSGWRSEWDKLEVIAEKQNQQS